MSTPRIVPITLTDPGEGLTEAEIIEFKVSVGDLIAINDIVVEVETAKSAVELPSPVAGRVTRICAAPGDEVAVGAVLLDVDTQPEGADVVDTHPDGDAQPDGAADGEISSDAPQPDETGATGGDEAAAPKILVGYGLKEGATQRRRRRAALSDQEHPPQVPVDRILAKPPVRKLARDLGIALADVFATGPDGTVTRDDVMAAAKPAASDVAERQGRSAEQPAGEENYFPDEHPQAPDDLGANMKTTRNQPFPGVVSDERTTRVPIRSVRKRTAEAMVSSAFTAPHVTVFNTVDMTETMRLVERLRHDRDWRDIKVSPLLIVAKALLVAIRRNPEVNASWDEDSQEIVYKHYVNLGIAAATPRGLIVPNIKDAHLKTLRELAEDIQALARTARAGGTRVADTRDGTITITNFGVFGIDSGTPILNPGESVILGFGAVKEKPWIKDGQIVPRQVTDLALSFDHRLIDGALGAELLRDVSAVLEHPEMGLVWG
ncbi:dihydrolipoamide acetyltransferase family protein [Devriesea agamarum]|uniref:dihydrolipoamide acetyltransferase family protein n=1 Tax=Devriesea agamarum TaxID=472569 RepID=UPI00071D6423|nr:dihydrolipoamide acetyltransferase family protein [Devriesea agamarum]